MAWQSKYRDLVGILFFGIVLTIIGGRCWTRLRPADEPHHPRRTALADFQDVVYYPARAALAGINPYDSRTPEDGSRYHAQFPAGNNFPVYGPLIFVFSLPLAVLPLVTAEIVYWLINVALLLLYAYVLLRMGRLPLCLGGVAGLAGILLLSRPGHANFYFGAITLPMILVTLAAWRLADRRPWLSAVCLAIALIKPTFGGPLWVLMLLRGKYRVAMAGLAGAIVASALVIAILLPQELTNRNLVETLTANQAITDSDPAVDPFKTASRIDVDLVVERLLGRHLPGGARLALTFLVLAVAGWHLRILEFSASDDESSGSREVERDDERLLSTPFACLTIAICIYHNIYDALLAAVSGVVAWRLLLSRAPGFGRRLAWPLMICVAVVALNYLSSKQFVALLGQMAPALSEGHLHGALWALVATINGVCLTIAWCLLLMMIRGEIGRRTLPA
jgi:hypothetical protein